MPYIDIDLDDFDDDDIVDHVLNYVPLVKKILAELDMESETTIDMLPGILENLKRDNIIAYENMLETLRYKELI